MSLHSVNPAESAHAVTQERVRIIWVSLGAILTVSLGIAANKLVDSFTAQQATNAEAQLQSNRVATETLQQVSEIRLQMELADFNTMRSDINQLKFDRDQIRKDYEGLKGEFKEFEIEHKHIGK